jgi:ABC-type transport system substrate-binding protein
MKYYRLLRAKWLILPPLLAVLVTAMACGGDGAQPTTAPEATRPPATTAPAVATEAPADATEAPAAATKAPATKAPEPTKAPIATPEPTTAPVVDEPKLGAKLTVAVNNFGNEIMNPVNGTKDYGVAMGTHAADFVMGVTPDNELTNAWGWADSWEQIDGSTWDITIRQGMVDHDGVEVTAEDGVWIANHWASDEITEGAIPGGWRKIFDRAEALDKYKLRIHLSNPYAFVFTIIPPVGGSDLYAFPKQGWLAGGETSAGFEKVGAPMTGFVDWTERKIGQFTRFVRFEDDYRADEFKFKFEEMEITLVREDAARLAVVKTGGADIANMSGPYVEEIQASGLAVAGPKEVDIVYLSTYQTYDPGHCTSKLNVRKAMNLAVDGQAILDGIWAPGSAVRAITPFTSPYDESWNPTLKPYGYDPEEARRLLKEAGCDGFKFISYGYAFAQGPEMRDMTDAIVTYLQGVGIDAEFVPIDPVPITQKRLEEKFGAADGPPVSGSHWQLGARNFADKIRVHGLCASQGGSVCNIPEPDLWQKKMLAYAAIMDPVERREVAQVMGQELYDMYLGIPIAYRNAIWALNPDTICGEWHPINGTPAHPMFNTLTPCDT